MVCFLIQFTEHDEIVRRIGQFRTFAFFWKAGGIALQPFN